MVERRQWGRFFFATLASATALSLSAQEPARPPAAAQAGASPLEAPVVLNDDGGWCWFQDERALVVSGRLVFGSVAAGRRDPSRSARPR